MPALADAHGRTFRYLRLSVTDVCNFRCTYCLPDGYKKQGNTERLPLQVHEIENLVSAFAGLGVTKVRLTGGEPSMRQDLVEIVSAVSKIDGIQTVALSTNGSRLKRCAPALAAAGLTALNVSVDSLDQSLFKRMTGHSGLADILEGIELAVKVGISPVKINAVLMKESSGEVVDSFREWVRTRAISVRFIELMRTGCNAQHFERQHVSGEDVRRRLIELGWARVGRRENDGPAQVYGHPDYAGTLGIIAPYSKDFCANCNRLRVSSYGGLRLCLFGEGDHPLRDLLQFSSQRSELIQQIAALMNLKPLSHTLHEEKYGNTWNLASIGG